jgi:hypothetical protein
MPASPSSRFGWWYLSIGICFLLLAIVHVLQGSSLAGIALRLGVAAGFAILGWMQLRSQ